MFSNIKIVYFSFFLCHYLCSCVCFLLSITRISIYLINIESIKVPIWLHPTKNILFDYSKSSNEKKKQEIISIFFQTQALTLNISIKYTSNGNGYVWDALKVVFSFLYWTVSWLLRWEQTCHCATHIFMCNID